ncbi:hypothetical protein DID78_03415 [Candidatus Marinamargulisbacteria bacterium SCGC AG-343-D04]|nr:hypothetical protein DID78_03415 [Candidatus Marinamargulisbacteria bacterium SCGC AG-343-D04]
MSCRYKEMFSIEENCFTEVVSGSNKRLPKSKNPYFGKFTPRPRQEDAFREAILKKRLIVGLDVGEGKTSLAIALMNHYMKNTGVLRARIICPKGLIRVWVQEIEKICNSNIVRKNDKSANWVGLMLENGGKICVSTPDLTLGNYRSGSSVDSIFKEDFNFIAVDEAHHFSNKGKHNQQLKEFLQKNLEREVEKKMVLMLTATPLTSSPLQPLELVSLMGGEAHVSQYKSAQNEYDNAMLRLGKRLNCALKKELSPKSTIGPKKLEKEVRGFYKEMKERDKLLSIHSVSSVKEKGASAQPSREITRVVPKGGCCPVCSVGLKSSVTVEKVGLPIEGFKYPEESEIERSYHFLSAIQKVSEAEFSPLLTRFENSLEGRTNLLQHLRDLSREDIARLIKCSPKLRSIYTQMKSIIEGQKIVPNIVIFCDTYNQLALVEYVVKSQFNLSVGNVTGENDSNELDLRHFNNCFSALTLSKALDRSLSEDDRVEVFEYLQAIGVIVPLETEGQLYTFSDGFRYDLGKRINKSEDEDSAWRALKKVVKTKINKGQQQRFFEISQKELQDLNKIEFYGNFLCRCKVLKKGGNGNYSLEDEFVSGKVTVDLLKAKMQDVKLQGFKSRVIPMGREVEILQNTVDLINRKKNGAKVLNSKIDTVLDSLWTHVLKSRVLLCSKAGAEGLTMCTEWIINCSKAWNPSQERQIMGRGGRVSHGRFHGTQHLLEDPKGSMNCKILELNSEELLGTRMFDVYKRIMKDVEFEIYPRFDKVGKRRLLDIFVRRVISEISKADLLEELRHIGVKSKEEVIEEGGGAKVMCDDEELNSGDDDDEYFAEIIGGTVENLGKFHERLIEHLQKDIEGELVFGDVSRIKEVIKQELGSFELSPEDEEILASVLDVIVQNVISPELDKHVENTRMEEERLFLEAAERAKREASERAKREAAERAKSEAAERAKREAAERKLVQVEKKSLEVVEYKPFEFQSGRVCLFLSPSIFNKNQQRVIEYLKMQASDKLKWIYLVKRNGAVLEELLGILKGGGVKNVSIKNCKDIKFDEKRGMRTLEELEATLAKLKP